MAEPKKGAGNKLLSLAKSEINVRLGDLKISGADKAANASSSAFAWIVIAFFGFFTYLSFLLWAPVFIADVYRNYFEGQGNPVLFGYSAVFLFHLIIFLVLFIFKGPLLKRSIYNKVFESILNIGE